MTPPPSRATTSCSSWLERWRVRRHFAGSISASAERKLRAHLSGCDDCRAYYQDFLLLAELDPQALPAVERLGRGLGLVERGKLQAALPALGALGLACAALLAFSALRARPDAADSQEFAARGSVAEAPSSFVRVYRAGATRAELVGGQIARDDELAFAYENRAGFEYLLVFGVDERGQVFWYYPAWTDASATPTALPIRKSRELLELPDAVRQKLVGKRLRLLSIFTHEPLSVRAVEERLTSLGAAHEGPLWRGTLEQELSLEVR